MKTYPNIMMSRNGIMMCECCGGDCKECGQTLNDYPWICFSCGRKYGKSSGGVSTMHNGKCGWCGKDTGVLHFRNYGYPKKPDQTNHTLLKEQD